MVARIHTIRDMRNREFDRRLILRQEGFPLETLLESESAVNDNMELPEAELGGKAYDEVRREELADVQVRIEIINATIASQL